MAQEKSQNEGGAALDVPSGCGSCRYMIAVMGMLGCTFLYLLRINFSIAIVCMTYENVTGNATSLSRARGPSHLEGVIRSYLGDDSSIAGFEEEPVCDDGDFEDEENRTGEFLWSRTLQGVLNSSFFWGYVLTQVLGGWLSTKYGGKRLVIVSLGASAVCCMLSPTFARISPGALMGMRFTNGLFQGVFYPALFTVNGKWFPVAERALLVSISLCGTAFGSILSMALSGIICAGLGWDWIFWMYGIFCVMWLLTWQLFVHESPSSHPNIKEDEYVYITGSLQNTARVMPPIPWKALCSSPKVWVLVLGDFCNGWAWYMSVLTYPQYYDDVLQVDIRTNGLLNSLPLAIGFPLNFAYAVAADRLIKKRILTVTKTRKLFHTITCLFPMGFAIGLGYLTCEDIPLAVFFMTMQAVFASANGSGEGVTRADIAPRFAGIVMGLTNTASNVAGVLAPIVISIITQDGTRRQWQITFWLAVSLGLVNWTCFMLFASAEEQEWAKVPEEMQLPEIKVNSNDNGENCEKKELASDVNGNVKHQYENGSVPDEYPDILHTYL